MALPVVHYYDKLPDFANDENRQLHAANMKKGEQYNQLDNDCKDLEERHNILKDHLHNVYAEVKSVEQLVIAKEKLAEEERHLQTLVERERGKIRVEVEKIDQETDTVQGKWSMIQSKMQVAQNRIEKFKEDMQINQKEFDQWADAAKQKEEDFQVIKQYSKDDEGKVKYLIMDIEKRAQMVDEKKAELDQEITNTRSLQIELDQTASYFRKIHEERARLLAQWEESLKQVQAMNERIDEATVIYEARNGEADKIHVRIAEQKKNMDLAVSANKQIERQVSMFDHQVAMKQKEVKKEEEQIPEFKEVVATERQKLDKCESDIRAYNEHIQDYRNKIAQDLQKREEYKKRLQETQNSFDLQKDYTKEITEQTNIMNDFYNTELLQIKQLDQTIDETKKQIYLLSQDVFKLRKDEKTMIAEIQGSQSRCRNLQLRINEYDKETLKQLELLYNANFQIAQMEHKIDLLLGRNDQEEKKDYQKQIDELEKILASKEEMIKVLKNALHRLDLDTRSSIRRKEKLTKMNEDLSTKLNLISIDQTSLDKSMINAMHKKEQALVQLNMIRLQIEKLSSQVEAKCDEVISLENRRQQLALSMQERAAELEANLQSLKVQLKVETEAKHIAVVELAERKKRASTLEAKYGIIMGDGTTEDMQTYHIIKFSREREEVARRGDELEEEVKSAIKQLRKLENEMEKLNIQTTEYKRNFQIEDPEVVEKKKSLEEQLRAAQERLYSKKALSLQSQEEREIMDRTYTMKQDSIAQMQNDISKMQPFVEKLQNENQELREKIKRANLALKRSREAVRKEENIGADVKYPGTLFEMNVEIHMEKGKVNDVLTELGRLAEGNREIETKLSLGLSQIGLALVHPVKPPASYQQQSPVSSARSGYSARSGASFRSGAISNGSSAGASGAPRTPRRYQRNMSPPVINNLRNSRASNASNYSKGSQSSRKSNASKGSKASIVSVHQIEFPM